MSNNKQQPKPENPNNQFSNTEPLTHAQRVAIANKMSNNKQSMKLYTETEILSLLKIHLADEEQADSFVALLTPIELPSDDEIWDKADEEDEIGKHYAFIRGAEWMRDKIGGNNEQQ